MMEDKLVGYSLGAEDYITKPFDEQELECKINVILRWHCKDGDADAPTQFSRILMRVKKINLPSRYPVSLLRGRSI